jgi:ABC-type transport system substrate-binding protein
LIGAIGAGATGALAGCNEQQSAETDTPTPTSGNGDGSTPTPTTARSDLPPVEGQTLRLSMPNNPENLTFLSIGGIPWPRLVTPYTRAHPVFPLVDDYGAFGPWSNSVINGGDIHLTSVEDYSIAEDEISWTYRSDAKWSNGDQILGRDGLTYTLAARMLANGTSLEEYRTQDVKEDDWEPGTFDAITDYEYDGRTATLVSSGGWFTTDEQSVLEDLIAGWGAPFGGNPMNNTRIEPYKSWADTIFEWWDGAVAGDIDPWGDDPEQHLKTALRKRAFGLKGDGSEKSEKWGDHQRNPDNVVNSGAFTLEEFKGSREIRLKKNEHFHSADKVNFDRIIVESRPEARANWAALKANRLDVYDRGTIPANTVDAFPDSFEQRLAKLDGGKSLSLNHADGTFFSDVKVRQAIMQLLNTEQIASTIHRDIHDGVTVVGGHPWETGDVVGQDWMDENLHDYSSDPDQAAKMLEEAGWSREGGTWYDADGEKATLTLPTTDNTPQMEVSVVNQLNNFGIDASVQTMNGSAFNEDRSSGNLDWAEDRMSRGVGWPHRALGRVYFYHVVIKGWSTWWNVFPQEQVEQADYLDNGLWNAWGEQEKLFKVEAPEVGDWNGPLKEWSPVHIGINARSTSVAEKRKEELRKLAWIVNWHIPVLPLTQQRQQQVIDTGHWLWPDADDAGYENVGVDLLQPEHLIANGHVSADPDNPEEGASVQE